MPNTVVSPFSPPALPTPFQPTPIHYSERAQPPMGSQQGLEHSVEADPSPPALHKG